MMLLLQIILQLYLLVFYKELQVVQILVELFILKN